MPLKIPRIALVTGGMGGLGEAICIKLAGLGYKVVTTYSPGNTKSQEWLDSDEQDGLRLPRLSLRRRRLGLVRRLREAGGGRRRPDRRAGQQRRHHPRHDLQEDGQGELGRGDPHQPRLGVQHDQAGLRRRWSTAGWGRIINISSVNGQKGAFGQINYSSAKAGMHGFSKALALEVARKGVTVNTISPGYIGTKMVMAIPQDVLDTKIIPQIPMGRLGKPEEVAGLVAYLSSDEAAFVTGANISINGGQHMF